MSQSKELKANELDCGVTAVSASPLINTAPSNQTRSSRLLLLLLPSSSDHLVFVTAVKVGLRHPDPVVETSSLSSVSPPDVWYRLTIPEEVIDRGCLSALQLEAITYAAQVITGN